jgi:hypothetical protein
MAVIETMLFLSKADTAAIVSLSRVPALVVMGTRDPDFPDATVEARWLGPVHNFASDANLRDAQF